MRPDRHNRPPWLLDKRLKRIYLYVKESWVAKCGSVCAHRGNTGPLCLISFIHCVSLAFFPSFPPFFPSFYTSLVDDKEKRQRIVSSSILNHHRTLSFLGRGSLVRTQWRCGQQCENKKKNRGACLGGRTVFSIHNYGLCWAFILFHSLFHSLLRTVWTLCDGR